MNSSCSNIPLPYLKFTIFDWGGKILPLALLIAVVFLSLKCHLSLLKDLLHWFYFHPHNILVSISICLYLQKNFFRFIAEARERFPIYPLSHMKLSPAPITNITPQNGTFFAKDKPVLTHDNHPEFIVYISIYSWCCIFYWFGHMYNDISISTVA